MNYLILTAVAVIAYLLGSVNPCIAISKFIFHKDIRTLGSGNAGFTNMYRNFGKIPAVVALILDPGKAVLSVFLGMILAVACGVPHVYGAYVAALFVVLGHIFPVYFKFKGGKGVLAMAGSLMVLHPYLFLIALAIFLAVLLITKYVSLGSIVGSSTYFVQLLVAAAIENSFDATLIFEVVMGFVIGALVVFAHRDNIRRLIRGQERKITDKKKTSLALKTEDTQGEAATDITQKTDNVSDTNTENAADKK